MSAAPALPSPYRAVVLDEIDSTNEEARRRALAGEPGPLWIVARRQTAGRGRRGRSWETGAANFAGTLLLRPARSPTETAQLSFVAALAVADALEEAGASGVRLKWPNDVLLGGAKVSGILLESASADSGRIEWVAVGIGVNLASAPQDVPYPATCLHAHLGGAAPEPEEFLESLACAWARRFEGWRSEGFGVVRTSWLAIAAGIGEALVARMGAREIEGVFIDLDPNGALILDTGQGRKSVSSGEVFFGLARQGNSPLAPGETD